MLQPLILLSYEHDVRLLVRNILFKFTSRHMEKIKTNAKIKQYFISEKELKKKTQLKNVDISHTRGKHGHCLTILVQSRPNSLW